MMQPHGISGHILAGGIKVRQWQIRDHATGEKAVFDLGVIADETDYPFRVQFEQSKICRIMDAMLRDDPAADIRYDTELLSADQDGNGVTIKVVRDGREEALRGRFLIAADGGGSTIRNQLGLPFDGSMYPERTVLVTTPFPF